MADAPWGRFLFTAQLLDEPRLLAATFMMRSDVSAADVAHHRYCTVEHDICVFITCNTTDVPVSKQA